MGGRRLQVSPVWEASILLPLPPPITAKPVLKSCLCCRNPPAVETRQLPHVSPSATKTARNGVRRWLAVTLSTARLPSEPKSGGADSWIPTSHGCPGAGGQAVPVPEPWQQLWWGGAGRAVLRGFAGFRGVSGIACRPLVERAFLRQSKASALFPSLNAAPAKLGGPACPCQPGWLGPRQTDTRLRGDKAFACVKVNVPGRCREVFPISLQEGRTVTALPCDHVCWPLCSWYLLLILKPP